MVHLDISDLTEDTQYYYAIEDRDGNIDERIGKFKTIKMGAYSFTFAAASCAKNGSDHFVFDNIASQPIKFFMNTGDIHYRDIRKNDVSLYAKGYKELFNSSRQRNLYQNNSFVYIWDDHDFGANGSWGGSRGKPAAQLAYRRYVPSHDLVLPKAGNGIYRAFSVGRVRFVITDLRSYSDKGGDALAPGRTLMGSAQKAWFKQELLKSRDAHKLIVWVCTTLWIGSPQSKKDRWFSFCAEREELADFFRDNDLDKGMCIISGDAHMLAADDGSNNTYGGDGSPMFPVFHAAAMDSSGSKKGGPYSEGTYPGGSRYGLFKVTDNGGDTVTLNFKGIKATSSTGSDVLIDYTFDSPKR
jgi:alkaline phosphatase D